MEWLYYNHDLLDFHENKVIIDMPNCEFVLIHGRKERKFMFISFTKDRTLINKGCRDYVALLTDVNPKYESFYEVDAVREFSDMFPEELPTLHLIGILYTLGVGDSPHL